MRVGALRNRVTLEMRQQAADGSTGIAETYALVAEVWGAVEATRGSVYIGSIQVGDAITHRITMRWLDPTTFTHLSVNEGAQRFRKRDARDPDGRRRWLEVMAEEMRVDFSA